MSSLILHSVSNLVLLRSNILLYLLDYELVGIEFQNECLYNKYLPLWNAGGDEI